MFIYKFYDYSIYEMHFDWCLIVFSCLFTT